VAQPEVETLARSYLGSVGYSKFVLMASYNPAMVWELVAMWRAGAIGLKELARAAGVDPRTAKKHVKAMAGPGLGLAGYSELGRRFFAYPTAEGSELAGSVVRLLVEALRRYGHVDAEAELGVSAAAVRKAASAPQDAPLVSVSRAVVRLSGEQSPAAAAVRRVLTAARPALLGLVRAEVPGSPLDVYVVRG